MRSLIVAFFASLACAAAYSDNIGIPLNDLGPRPYRLGYIGGLYENGTNHIPSDHLEDGMRFAQAIEPLDVNGHASPDGKIGLITIGNGDTVTIVCSPYHNVPCDPGSFTGMIENNPRVNPAVVVINAAFNDFTLTNNHIDPILDNIKAQLLSPAGLSEQQVQVAWMQMSYEHPEVDITCACASDYNLKVDIGQTLRALQSRYPNLHIAYLSSRPYAGYSPDAWNAEPFAYDTAITMRIMILDQLEQVRFGAFMNDTRVGPISYKRGEAPWIGWGPYMWANGTTPRSDGLTWQPEDYTGEFLSEQGAHKAATLLLDFLMTDPMARLWFSATGGPTRARAVHH